MRYISVVASLLAACGAQPSSAVSDASAPITRWCGQTHVDWPTEYCFDTSYHCRTSRYPIVFECAQYEVYCYDQLYVQQTCFSGLMGESACTNASLAVSGGLCYLNE